MLTAVMLIKTERTRTIAVGEALAEMEGISEVYTVAGRYDLVAMVRVPRNEDLADLVTGRVAELEGILDHRSGQSPLYAVADHAGVVDPLVYSPSGHRVGLARPVRIVPLHPIFIIGAVIDVAAPVLFPGRIQQVIQAAVEVLAPLFCNNVDNTRLGVAELGLHSACNHGEFLNSTGVDALKIPAGVRPPLHIDCGHGHPIDVVNHVTAPGAR